MDGIHSSTNQPVQHSNQDGTSPVAVNNSLRWGVYLLIVSGSMFIVHGIGFLYRTFYSEGFELGVDTLGGITRAQLAASNPAILSYIDHLHVSMAGLMIAVGIGIVLLSWYGVRNGDQWALATAIALPVVFLAHSLPIHQSVHFDFDAILHLGPAAIGAPVMITGAVLAYVGLRSIEDNDKLNE